jgi:hypothetical protein
VLGHLILQIKTRTAGTWQGSTTVADVNPERSDNRFVLFVDLADDKPDYYVVPEWWFQLDVHRELIDYLARHPGLRTSTHHAIPTSRIKQWHAK